MAIAIKTNIFLFLFLTIATFVALLLGEYNVNGKHVLAF
jgi:hypothetical protein